MSPHPGRSRCLAAAHSPLSSLEMPSLHPKAKWGNGDWIQPASGLTRLTECSPGPSGELLRGQSRHDEDEGKDPQEGPLQGAQCLLKLPNSTRKQRPQLGKQRLQLFAHTSALSSMQVQGQQSASLLTLACLLGDASSGRNPTPSLCVGPGLPYKAAGTQGQSSQEIAMWKRFPFWSKPLSHQSHSHLMRL